MRTIELGAAGAKKILKNNCELFKNDFEDSIKSFTPGEWCLFFNKKKQVFYTGYINPLVENNRPCAYVVSTGKLDGNPWEKVVLPKLDAAILKRETIFEYGHNARLVYGQNDGLPGLIIDSYLEKVIVQINTAGMDKFREGIKTYLMEKLSGKEVIFLDNEKYRMGECLPVFNTEGINADLLIQENDLTLRVSKEAMQKVGYYYDHRENRAKASNIIKKLQKDDLSALDLFCYVGSWGLNLLKTNCTYVGFVDQGNFSKDITWNLDQNDFKGKGEFFRANVFEFLKEEIAKGKSYDVICSDPPAFCKSKKEKQKAYDGYLKLHRSCLRLIGRQGIFLASSCTHYVNHEEFQNTVIEAAAMEGRQIQLIEVGCQGYDHPIKSSYDKSSYLKYYAYYVE